MALLKIKRAHLTAVISASALVIAATVLLIIEIRDYQQGRYGTNEGYFADSGQNIHSSAGQLSTSRRCESSEGLSEIESAPTYVAMSENGIIVVRDRFGSPVVRIDTLCYVLTERDRCCLDGGIELYGEQSLDSFICDYSG